MKKYIIIISSIAVLCYASYFWFGIFTPYNYFSAKDDIRNGNIYILIYGEELLKEENSMAKKLGIHYKRVGGCTDVTWPLENRVEIYNNVVYEYLEKIYGKDLVEEVEIQL